MAAEEGTFSVPTVLLRRRFTIDVRLVQCLAFKKDTKSHDEM